LNFHACYLERDLKLCAFYQKNHFPSYSIVYRHFSGLPLVLPRKKKDQSCAHTTGTPALIQASIKGA
jgi:hypothetical protein